MFGDTFLSPDQVLIEILWRVLSTLTLCALGLFASIAIFALASSAASTSDATKDRGEVQGV